MNPTTPLLQLDRICRSLAGREVVRGVSFTLQRGEVVGLLGVNGAGKSTTLAIIAGALAPDAGSVRIDGDDLADAPCRSGSKIGWLPENVPLWPELTVTETLEACSRLHGMSRAAAKSAVDRELLRLDLAPMARRVCGQLSLGQKRRLGLAMALLHDPDLLVLDEPGNGLDPVQTAQLRELIRTLSCNRRGIVLSTHVLGEVEAMCQRVVILHEGAVRHDAQLAGDHGMLDRLFLAIVRDHAAAPA
jgi:gliding motility-associated transport system ATP-binding protein